jgi:hypothetical protein
MENSEFTEDIETFDDAVEVEEESLDSDDFEVEELDDAELEEEDSDDEADDDDSQSVENDYDALDEAAQGPQAPVVSMETLPITGEARVDDALGRLADLQGLPVHEHVAVFEDVQRRLHDTLADLTGQ